MVTSNIQPFGDRENEGTMFCGVLGKFLWVRRVQTDEQVTQVITIPGKRAEPSSLWETPCEWRFGYRPAMHLEGLAP